MAMGIYGYYRNDLQFGEILLGRILKLRGSFLLINNGVDNP